VEINEDMVNEILHILKQISPQSEYKKRAVDIIWQFEEMCRENAASSSQEGDE